MLARAGADGRNSRFVESGSGPVGFTSYPPNGTIFDSLDHAGVSWKHYCATLGVVVSTAELYPELYARNVGTNVVGIEHFFADAAGGRLPGLPSHQVFDHTSICALVEAKWTCRR